ncbi:Holliday junction branch migration protein RuvA [Ilyobacter polytropus]|uniref:Holliday junction branch migration complex subunit RuvA n=1 Tax=Ilyobacter polytropus (strain ATCC 51220 / DSM 2926 / LMG 16218 / CuHBu1) TaxID=572544 RepID=E3HB48_ILYPC|nr:Holliday junction branch migration protein RuvA [Ilyobacter polytropus]ADO82199.1 Holliday junction DNA helicase subunit RuvA [Ilyobacter polytropus DSM 2926]
MFEYLKGELTLKKLEYAVVDINGIGYKVNISLKTYEKLVLGEKTKLYIYNYIREDMFKLIGFAEEKERNLFEILINVNGIGVSLALAILSTFDVEDMRDIVSREDVKLLTKVPKLGIKKAQKLIVDVKDKLKGLQLEEGASGSTASKGIQIEEELYMALESLGYSKKDIEKLVTREEIMAYEGIEAAIKDVLKKIQSKL